MWKHCVLPAVTAASLKTALTLHLPGLRLHDKPLRALGPYLLLKAGTGPAVSAPPRGRLGVQILGPGEDLLNQNRLLPRCWGRGHGERVLAHV